MPALPGDRQQMAMRLRSKSFIISLVVCIGSGVALFLSSRPTRPLTRLTEVAQKLARGDFAAAEKISITSKNEVGALVQVFTEMSKEIRNSYEKPDDYRARQIRV